MNPKVTIVVPVFKVENTIRRCVDSLIMQSLKEIEIVLVDDGSPDISRTICDEYTAIDDRIKVIHKENGGASSARNAGIKVAQGDYIGFVDSDDYVEKSMYEVMYNIAKSKNIDVVNCGVFHENTAEVNKISTQFEKNKVLTHSDLMVLLHSFENHLKDFYWCWRNIYRKKLLKKHAILFDESVKYGEDTNFNLLVYYHAKSFYVTNKYFYHYVENPSGVMNAKFKERYLEQLSMTYFKRLVIFESNGLANAHILISVCTTVIENHLLLLIFNAWETPHKDFIKQLKLIRNSKMVSDSFIYYHNTGKLTTAMQFIVYLMKFRMYYLVRIFFEVMVFIENFAS